MELGKCSPGGENCAGVPFWATRRAYKELRGCALLGK